MGQATELKGFNKGQFGITRYLEKLIKYSNTCVGLFTRNGYKYLLKLFIHIVSNTVICYYLLSEPFSESRQHSVTIFPTSEFACVCCRLQIRVQNIIFFSENKVIQCLKSSENTAVEKQYNVLVPREV